MNLNIKKNALPALVFITLFSSLSIAFAGTSSFKQAAIHVDKEEFQRSYDILLPETNGVPETTEEFRTIFLAGFSALQLGLFKECSALLQKLEGTKYLLADYATFNLSTCYAESGQFDDALNLLKNFYSKYPQSRIKKDLLFNKAKYQILSDKTKKGLKNMTLFVDKYKKSDLAPEAHYLKGQALEKIGKLVRAYEPYRYLYYSYPKSPFAEMALERTKVIRLNRNLKIAGTPLSMYIKRGKNWMKKGNFKEAIKDFNLVLRKSKSKGDIETVMLQLATCYKRTGKKAKTEATLLKHVKIFPNVKNSPQALYRLGKFYWNRGRLKLAVRYLQMATDRFSWSKWGEKSKYVVGRIFEEQGRIKEALKKYKYIAKKAKSAELREEALWQLGWVYYTTKQLTESIKVFKEATSTYKNSNNRSAYIYWQGRATELNGDKDGAQKLYSKLDEFPLTYYSALSRKRIKGMNHKLKSMSLTTQKKPGAENKTKQDMDKILSGLKKGTREHVDKGIELIELGLFEYARSEISSVARAFRGKREKRLALSTLYEKARQYNRSFYIRSMVLLSLGPKEKKSTSEEFWQIFFPRSYWELVSKHSAANDIDPFLTLSIIKQESLYDPFAQSAANAMGLMQVMPKTGAKLYKKLIGKGFDEKMLFEPDVNLKLGVRYLSDLLRKYKNDLVLSIASYNAGPTPVKKWAKRNKNLPTDEFIEKISYPETRKYVKKVLQNYENYKYVYSSLQGKSKEWFLYGAL